MGMGLIHFKGENVVDCVATLRSVLMFLGHGTTRSQCPPTLMKILVDIFLRCSNAVFVQYVRNLADFHESEINTPEKLFAKVQLYYNELLMKPNGWIRTTKNKAAFYAELPELAAIMEAQGPFNDPAVTGVPLEVSTQQPQAGSGSGRRNRNRNRRNQANVASTGGNSGNNANNEKDAQGRYIYDRQGNVIDRKAPQDGQPTRRNRPDGTLEYWCGPCERWGNHDGEHHDEFVERRNRNRERYNRNRGGNGSNSGNSNDGAGGNGQNQSSSGSSNANQANPPSMHRATVAQPIISLLSGRFSNLAYDSDDSF